MGAQRSTSTVARYKVRFACVLDVRQVMNLRCCSSQSLLVPLSPSSLSFWERINKLLTPSVHVLGILRDSFKSGEQRQFAQRVWAMAQSNEPFILASRALSQTYELWKEKDETADEDDKKNPP